MTVTERANLTLQGQKAPRINQSPGGYRFLNPQFAYTSTLSCRVECAWEQIIIRVHKATAAAHCLGGNPAAVERIYILRARRQIYETIWQSGATHLGQILFYEAAPKSFSLPFAHVMYPRNWRSIKSLCGPIRLEASDRFPGIMTLSGSSFDVVPLTFIPGAHSTH
jgi:hypothetical protein